MKPADINAALLRVLREEIEEALKPIANKHGITLVPARGTYGHTFGSFKLDIGLAAAEGVDPLLVTREAESFKVNATLFGFQPTDLGREFSVGRDQWRIVGLKGRATKNCILIENLSTKKIHVCREEFVPFYVDPFGESRGRSFRGPFADASDIIENEEAARDARREP